MTQQDHPRGDDDRGANDPGENGEDRDILGKEQEDLTADDLAGDGRTEDAASPIEPDADPDPDPDPDLV